MLERGVGNCCGVGEVEIKRVPCLDNLKCLRPVGTVSETHWVKVRYRDISGMGFATMKSKLLTAAAIGSCLSFSDAKFLWAKSPATYGPSDSDTYLLKTGYPVGNGKLGGQEHATCISHQRS
jgi:hypothetical protein